MKRLSVPCQCLCSTALVAALAGCHAAPVTERDAVLALGVLGPQASDPTGAGKPFYFGAGDALGYEIFTYYVASLRTSDEFYATGAEQRPDAF